MIQDVDPDWVHKLMFVMRRVNIGIQNWSVSIIHIYIYISIYIYIFFIYKYIVHIENRLNTTKLCTWAMEVTWGYHTLSSIPWTRFDQWPQCTMLQMCFLCCKSPIWTYLVNVFFRWTRLLLILLHLFLGSSSTGKLLYLFANKAVHHKTDLFWVAMYSCMRLYNLKSSAYLYIHINII